MTSLYPKIPLFSTIEKPTRWRLTEISCETLSRSLQWRSSWKYQIWLKSHFILVINCHLGPLAHQNSTFHGTVYKVCHKGSFRYLEKNKTFNMLLFFPKIAVNVTKYSHSFETGILKPGKYTVWIKEQKLGVVHKSQIVFKNLSFENRCL